MSVTDSPRNWLHFLEELRSIAGNGLEYCTTEYDRERYQRLMALTAVEYGQLSGVSPDIIERRFRSETGYVTPKVGVEAAIFDDAGGLLMVRREDDGLWSLPSGWVEVNEEPAQSMERELTEEIGITSRTGNLIGLFARRAGDCGQPHSSVHLLYSCRLISGTPRPVSEVLEVMWGLPADVPDWHRDHKAHALVACAHRRGVL